MFQKKPYLTLDMAFLFIKIYSLYKLDTHKSVRISKDKPEQYYFDIVFL